MRSYTQQEILEALDASTYDGQVNEVMLRTRLGLPLSESESAAYAAAREGK